MSELPAAPSTPARRVAPCRRAAATAAAAIALGGVAPSRAAIDLRALWDFDHPEVAEARFRAAARDATGDDQAILQTQIARTYGLRRDFTRAREILAAVEPQLPRLGAEAQARWRLEWGRTWASATHRPDELNADARERAREAFLQAFATARAAGLDDLAVDALHMMPFVETDPALRLAWNRSALALAERSPQPAARRWETSLRNNLGVSLHELGRYDEALALFESNVAAAERAGNAAQLRIARWMVAWTLRAQGRIDDALAIQLRLERENAAAGTPDPDVYDELALLYRSKGDAERQRHYEQLRAQAPAR
jgi:tetratricopeptide (TPR) repeat protein